MPIAGTGPEEGSFPKPGIFPRFSLTGVSFSGSAPDFHYRDAELFLTDWPPFFSVPFLVLFPCSLAHFAQHKNFFFDARAFLGVPPPIPRSLLSPATLGFFRRGAPTDILFLSWSFFDFFCLVLGFLKRTLFFFFSLTGFPPPRQSQGSSHPAEDKFLQRRTLFRPLSRRLKVFSSPCHKIF